MSKIVLPVFHSADDIVKLINELGFLPFFRNEIEGFSIAECCPPELWFSDVDGPWEWKGPIIKKAGCAYGKFYKNKAMFVSREWFPDFANYRRDGYDYDSRIDQGIARHKDNDIMIKLMSLDSDILSKNLKADVCPDKESRKTFDSSLSFLQMQCYVTTTDFEYMRDKNGKVYGWGVARYATPEAHFGADFKDRVYRNEPEESKSRILTHLKSILPDCPEKHILKLIG